MAKRVTHTVNGRYPGVRLRGVEQYKKLYHYTSFDTFVKIWLTKQLKFGITENVNDLQEAEISCQITNPQQAPLLFAYNKIKNEYKQISLTMDYDTYFKGCMSTMMWGHYADRRKGVCIELEFDKLIFPDNCLKGVVKYKTALPKHFTLDPNIRNEEQLRRFVKRKSKEVFFSKLLGWKGENEYRIVCNTSDFLNIENAITAVYLTSCDSLECQLVETLVSDTTPVRYLKYIHTSNGLSLPVLSDTKQCREQNISAKNNPKNALNTIMDQAKKIYESANGDAKTELLQTAVYLPKE